MLKKILATALFIFAATFTVNAYAEGDCPITFVIDSSWTNYNIAFETKSGEGLAVYQAKSEQLTIKLDRECIPGQQLIIANPSLGITGARNAGYASRVEYPTDKPVIISFPKDFPEAPAEPNVVP